MSIKANELRVGNIVYYFSDNSDTWFNDRVLSENDMICLLSDNGDHAENIPLTEEWLLKFGFEYIGICDDFPKGYYKHKALLEICFDNTFEPAVTVNNWGATYIMVPEMKYVHQLQNLFYALTGEELTIKNP